MPIRPSDGFYDPPDGFYEAEKPLVEQCKATESGGTQCEVLLLTPDEVHSHWVSQETINRRLGY